MPATAKRRGQRDTRASSRKWRIAAEVHWIGKLERRAFSPAASCAVVILSESQRRLVLKGALQRSEHGISLDEFLRISHPPRRRSGGIFAKVFDDALEEIEYLVRSLSTVVLGLG